MFNNEVKLWLVRVIIMLGMGYLGIDNFGLAKERDWYQDSDRYAQAYIDDLKEQRDSCLESLK